MVLDGSSDALSNKVFSVVLGLSGGGDFPEPCFDGRIDELSSVLFLPGSSVEEVFACDCIQIAVLVRDGGPPIFVVHWWVASY